MTMEKAIETLSIIKAYEIDNSIRGAEDREAIDMAIKTLEQQPCEDCISRQAALELIADYDLSMGEVVRGIHALPSVNPAKTGYWIADVDKWGDVVTTINGYKCSECGGFNADKDNYCPNCGAKMQEVEG